jgi:hypothetical protein
MTLYKGQGLLLKLQQVKQYSIGQWSRKEGRKGPKKVESTIFNKVGKTTQWSKGSFINVWYWNNWTAICKKVNLNKDLTSFTKINCHES